VNLHDSGSDATPGTVVSPQFSAALLLTLLCFAMLSWALVYDPHPTKSQRVILDMIFALAAGSAASLFTGSAIVKLKGDLAPGFQMTAQFMGGISVFILCWLNPLFPLPQPYAAANHFYPATVTYICGQRAESGMLVSKACDIRGKATNHNVEQRVAVLIKAKDSNWRILNSVSPAGEDWAVLAAPFPVEAGNAETEYELLAVSADADDLEDAGALNAAVAQIRNSGIASRYQPLTVRVSTVAVTLERVCGRPVLTSRDVEVEPVCDVEGSSGELPAGAQVCVTARRLIPGGDSDTERGCSESRGGNWAVSGLRMRMVGNTGATHVEIRSSVAYEAAPGDAELPVAAEIATSQTVHVHVAPPSVGIERVQSTNGRFAVIGHARNLLANEETIALEVETVARGVPAKCMLYAPALERWSTRDAPDARVLDGDHHFTAFIGASSATRTLHFPPYGYNSIELQNY